MIRSLHMMSIFSAAILTLGLLVGAPAQAASLQTVLNGIADAQSFDALGLFVASPEPGALEGLPVELIILWNSEATGKDPALSTLAADADSGVTTHSFAARDGAAASDGVTQLLLNIGGPASDYTSFTTGFAISHRADAARGLTDTIITVDGAAFDARFRLLASFSGAWLANAADAAFQLDGPSLSEALAAFSVQDGDGRENAHAGFTITSVSTTRLDGEVPLPGGLVLLAGPLGLMLWRGRGRQAQA